MIKTKRLELVKFDVKYASDLYELWNDFEVIKYTYMPLLNSIDECVVKIEMFINYTDKEFLNNFIILLDNKAVGIIGAPVINKEEAAFGLYYQLARAYWGNGYISEAAMGLKEYMTNKYPNVILNADAVSINTASLEVLRKLGLKQVGVEKKGFTLNNLELDLIKFSNSTILCQC